MTQLFKRRSNSVMRVVLVGIAASAVLTFAFWTVIKWSPWETEVAVAIEQPVPFSHQHHVSGLGLDCRYCHTSVDRAAFAGIPPTHTCMTCHSQIWSDAPMLKPVRDSALKSEPLKWNRVNRLPKYVYFNHSIHVNQGIGCTSCHGDVGKMPLTAKANPFYMKDCLACHREPEKYIRPRSEVFNPHWVSPVNQLQQGAKLVQEYKIPKHRLTDCMTCHR
jgi:hypothetical protein